MVLGGFFGVKKSAIGKPLSMTSLIRSSSSIFVCLIFFLNTEVLSISVTACFENDLMSFYNCCMRSPRSIRSLGDGIGLWKAETLVSFIVSIWSFRRLFSSKVALLDCSRIFSFRILTAISYSGPVGFLSDRRMSPISSWVSASYFWLNTRLSLFFLISTMMSDTSKLKVFAIR